MLRSPLSKCGVLLTSLCTASILAASAWAAEVPPPSTLTVEKLDAYCAEIQSSAAGKTSVGARNQAVQQKFDQLISDRAKEYEGYVITVTSKTKEAQLGTKLNFSTEKKHVSFTISPPADIPGLEIADYRKEPWIKKTRGNEKRIEGRDAKKTSADQVTFRFTLVEPNAAEKNIHVDYNGWVKYRYTAAGAMAAAAKDLASVKTFAEELKAAEMPVLPTAADVPPPAKDIKVPVTPTFDTEKAPFSWPDKGMDLVVAIVAVGLIAVIRAIYNKIMEKWRGEPSNVGTGGRTGISIDIRNKIPPLPIEAAQEKSKKNRKSFADFLRRLFRRRLSAENE